tara:strand:+ start:2345 stop:2494 length:150 start_codon:yes stop_codon:yes gene_type:complete
MNLQTVLNEFYEGIELVVDVNKERRNEEGKRDFDSLVNGSVLKKVEIEE